MYKHTQHVPAGVFTAYATLSGLSTFLAPKPLRALSRLSLAGTLYTFRCLTVTVDETNITLEFGNWLRVKTIPIENIESCKVKQTHAVIGWGVHFVGDGWLYRVDGQEAVRIKLKTGEKIFIGSDDAATLEESIKTAIAVYQPA